VPSFAGPRGSVVPSILGLGTDYEADPSDIPTNLPPTRTEAENEVLRHQFSFPWESEAAEAERRQKLEKAKERVAAEKQPPPPPISNTPYPDTAPVRESVKAREKQNAAKPPEAPTSFKPVEEPAAPTETPYDKLLEKIGASLDKREKGIESSREQDKYLALLQAGLGMMGGTSPFAAANIGQGASSGIAAMMAANKQRAAEENSIMAGQLGQAKMGLYRDMHLEDIKQKSLARGDLNAARNAELAQKSAYYAQKLGVDQAKVNALLAANWAKATKDFEESPFGLGALVADMKKRGGDNWKTNSELLTMSERAKLHAISERAGKMMLPDEDNVPSLGQRLNAPAP
jgi:hypothetical protein